MNKNRILSHLVILGSGRIATMLISVIPLILGTRYLGPSRVGELAFAGAVVGILGQANAMGMETFLVRAIARDPEQANTLVGAALLTRLGMAIPIPIILALYIYLAQVDREIASIAYILAVGVILWSFTVVFLWMLQGLEKMSFVAGADIILNIFGLVMVVSIVLLHGGVLAFAAVAPISNLILLVVTLYRVRPYVRITWRTSWIDIREVVTGSLAFWAKDLTMTMYTYIDSVLLGSLAGARAVGFYRPPTEIFAVALSVPNVVGNATLPLLSRLGIETAHDFARVGRKTLALLMLIGVPLVVGLATLAGPVIAILFGPAFEPAVPVLVVLSLCLVPMFLNSQFAQILSARDQQWRWTGIMMLCGLINVGINLIMIPLAVHYWQNGALGAAAALLVTELLMVIYGAVILHDVVIESSFARTVFAALVAGTAQTGVVLLMGFHLLFLLVGEALGVGIYAAIIVALGAIPRDDVEVLWNVALRRVPRAA